MDSLRRSTTGLKAYRKKLVESIVCYSQLAVYMQGCGCSKVRCEVARRPVYLLEGEIHWVDDLICQLRRR